MKKNKLEELFRNQIKQKLTRTLITSPSKWAEEYRVMGGSRPGKFRFKYFPWLRGMHDSKAELNIGAKSAQMGYTETLLNVIFYSIDIRQLDCLYVLPNKVPDSSDFSSARFDPALELSPHLHDLFSDVKNVGHKRAGGANLYVRGSNSRSQLKSIPVSVIGMDEIDEMNQENIPLAFERTSGQIEKYIWMISTPTIPGHGIDKYYERTTKEHFFFKCPGCSKYIEFEYPDSLVICGDDLNDPRIKESHTICTQCKKVLGQEDKWEYLDTGIWVPTYKERDPRGFHINQMYSSSIQPMHLAQSYFKGLTNPADEVELFNSKLGLPHITEGARVDDIHIQNCMGNYITSDSYIPKNKVITIGIDVGKWNHYEVDEWTIPRQFQYADANMVCQPRVIQYGKVRTFAELDALVFKYEPRAVVIDMNPETREAQRFAIRHHGRVYLCLYPNTSNAERLTEKHDSYQVNANRTSWLDTSLGRFHNGTIQIPSNVDLEYKSHIKAPVRVYKFDKDGNPVGRYITDHEAPDHYAHARNYAEIALPLALKATRTTDIR